MENEKSSIEILEAFATATGRKASAGETWFPSGISNPTIQSRRRIVIPESPSVDLFYIAYDAVTVEFGKYTLYSGVFAPVELPAEFQLLVQKADTLDRFKRMFRRNVVSTGSNERFDSMTEVTTSDQALYKSLLGKLRIQREVMEILEMGECLRLGINEITRIPCESLKDRSTLAAFISHKWILDGQLIEWLFGKVKKIKEEINKTVAQEKPADNNLRMDT